MTTLDTTLSRYDSIRDISPATSARITQFANAAHNEAEFEREVNNIIRDIAKEMDVQLLHREQYTLATSRADAVYNRFIIEFEPSSLRSLAETHPDNEALERETEGLLQSIIQT